MRALMTRTMKGITCYIRMVDDTRDPVPIVPLKRKAAEMSPSTPSRTQLVVNGKRIGTVDAAHLRLDPGTKRTTGNGTLFIGLPEVGKKITEDEN